MHSADGLCLLLARLRSNSSMAGNRDEGFTNSSLRYTIDQNLGGHESSPRIGPRGCSCSKHYLAMLPWLKRSVFTVSMRCPTECRQKASAVDRPCARNCCEA